MTETLTSTTMSIVVDITETEIILTMTHVCLIEGIILKTDVKKERECVWETDTLKMNVVMISFITLMKVEGMCRSLLDVLLTKEH